MVNRASPAISGISCSRDGISSLPNKGAVKKIAPTASCWCNSPPPLLTFSSPRQVRTIARLFRPLKLSCSAPTESMNRSKGGLLHTYKAISSRRRGKRYYFREMLTHSPSYQRTSSAASSTRHHGRVARISPPCDTFYANEEYTPFPMPCLEYGSKEFQHLFAFFGFNVGPHSVDYFVTKCVLRFATKQRNKKISSFLRTLLRSNGKRKNYSPLLSPSNPDKRISKKRRV